MLDRIVRCEIDRLLGFGDGFIGLCGEDRHEDRVLRPEVVVDGPRRDPRFLGDALHGGFVVPARAEELARDADDLVERLLLLLFPATCHSEHTLPKLVVTTKRCRLVLCTRRRQ